MRRAYNVAYTGGIRDLYTGLWWGNLRERDHLKKLRVDGKIKWIIQEVGWGAGTGLI